MSYLNALQDWAPFHIDALGIVTILGARSVNNVLGQFTVNRFTDWLPQLAAHVIATDEITEQQGGFALYNITDGIVATDLVGWFTRWLLSEDFTPCASLVRITAATHPAPNARQKTDGTYALLFGCIGIIPGVISGLIGDWWGLANGIVIFVNVVVRQLIVAQNRSAIDHAMDKAAETSEQPVKVFLTLPNGTAITVYTTRGIVIECLLRTPRPLQPRLYQAARIVGWLAFGVHMIALGMASLLSQILCVVLLISATSLTSWQIGANRCCIGQSMELTRMDFTPPFRAATYARLELTKAEEDLMVMWHLLPHKSNEGWWEKYNATKQANNFENWSAILAQDAHV